MSSDYPTAARPAAPYCQQLTKSVRCLRALGERRRAALVEAESVLRRVEELLPDAVQAGCSITEIAELSAVSRPTLYKLLPIAQDSK
jgi:hypothetical protein